MSALSSESTAVELTGIARRFGARWVLRGATLTVARGEVVCILGRNGSGKTTLLRIMATLLRPSRGSGSIFGHDLLAHADDVRSRIGLLAHANAIYPDLTAAENLGFALRMLGRAIDPRFVDTALGAVGLASQANVRARGFSAGMQRRLALARLRMVDPHLVLLDEPYSSLDPEGTELVSTLIADVRQRGGAAIVVTHDVPRAMKLADRILALVDGRVVPWTAHHVTRADIVDEPSPVGSKRA